MWGKTSGVVMAEAFGWPGQFFRGLMGTGGIICRRYGSGKLPLPDTRGKQQGSRFSK
jgi:hypothetical protein